MQFLTKVCFAIAEKISPKTAGKWGVKRWFTPAKQKISTGAEILLEAATQKRVAFKDSSYHSSLDSHYTLYRWGEGPIVLLVHDWGGRAAQMAALAKPLTQAGYQVLTFDALAHGNSSGKQTDIFEMSQIINDLDKRCDGFHTIIALSVGAIAAALAVRNGVRTERMILCSTAASMDYYIKKFAAQIGASRHTLGKIAFEMNRRFNININDLSLINLGPKLETPVLILHDKHDEEVPHTEALALSKCWPRSQLLLTENLGHRGILKDEQTIAKMVQFISNPKSSQPEQTSPLKKSAA